MQPTTLVAKFEIQPMEMKIEWGYKNCQVTKL